MKLILTSLFAVLAHLTALAAAQATFPHQFNLAAVNTTLPNANKTGAPLVLGAGGATGGVTVYSTSTWNSFPYGSLNTFGLVNNALRAYLPDGTWAINGTAVEQGGALTWIASRMYGAPQEQNAVYSVVTPSGSDFPRLAAYDRADLWSLCPDKYSNPQTRLVYNVASLTNPPSWLSFDPANCYGVVVNVLAI